MCSLCGRNGGGGVRPWQRWAHVESVAQAAIFFEESGSPSPFSAALLQRLYRFANTCLDRDPLSDWTYTNSPNIVNFIARPVYGAMFAPVLVAQQAAGAAWPWHAHFSVEPWLADATGAAARANALFAHVHGERVDWA